MNTAFFLLACAVVAQFQFPEKRVEIIIHVDQRNPVEATLKSELTVDWQKRVNPVVAKKGFSQNQLDFFEKANQRVSSIKKMFDITFEDRTRSRADFGFTIGKHGRLNKLPNEKIMGASTKWIELFEFLVEDFEYQNKKVIPWKEECHLIDVNADSRLSDYKFEFAKQYVESREGWYVGEASEGIYDNDNNYYIVSDLEGYSPQIAKEPYPPKPPKPISPVAGFDFSWSPNSTE